MPFTVAHVFNLLFYLVYLYFLTREPATKFFGGPLLGSSDAAHARGETRLMQTAAGGHTARVQALLAQEVDVNAVDADGRTALMFAAD
ncbi:MAG: ankyrin repeat domain-containing protein, partial [Candidatus Binatia bacterium]